MSVEEYMEILNIICNDYNKQNFIKIMGELANYAEAGYALDLNNDIIMEDYISKDKVTDSSSKIFAETTKYLNYQLMNYQLLEEIIKDIKIIFASTNLTAFNTTYQNYKDVLLASENLKSDMENFI